MAVSETFLRGGHPIDEMKKFNEYSVPLRSVNGKAPLSRWYCVTITPPMWAIDSRFYCFHRPSVLAIFVAPMCEGNVPTVVDETFVVEWRLAFCSDVGARGSGLVGPVSDTLVAALKAVAPSERPASVVVTSRDMTPPSVPPSPLALIEAPAKAIADIVRVAFPDSSTLSISADGDLGRSTALDGIIDGTLAWMAGKSKQPLKAAAFPPISPILNAALRSDDSELRNRGELLLKRIVSLSTTSPLATGVFDAPPPPPPSHDAPPRPQRPASEALTLRALQLPMTCAENKSLALAGAVILQRPAEAVTRDPSVLTQGTDALEAAQGANPARGSLPYPAGACAELHLHTDLGDAVHACRRLRDVFTTDWYEDTLHLSDGEVLVHFGPADGVDFADLELFAPLVAADAKLPRMFRRVPSGTAERRTPVENPHMVVNDTSLASLDELEAVVGAAEAVSEMLRVTSDGKRCVLTADGERADGEAALPQSAPTCHWCGRVRTKMSRCGGCKAANYCCAKHQTQDWKGRHKTECKLVAAARADTEAVLAEVARGRGVDDASVSDARSIAFMLRSFETRGVRMIGTVLPGQAPAAMSPLRRFVIHIIGIVSSARDAFIAALGTELAAGCSRFLPLPYASDFAELRIIVAGDKDSEATLPPAVFRGVAPRDGPKEGTTFTSCLKLAAPTGVLGDLWHERGEPAEGDTDAAPSCHPAIWPRDPVYVVVRCCAERYHHFMSKFESEPTAQPDAVLLVGGRTNEGMTFFSAAAEVLQDYAGRVPIGICEASRVAVHRTLEALQARASMRQGAPAAVGTNIELNTETFCRTAAASTPADSTTSLAPLFPNSFYAAFLAQSPS